MEGRLERLSLAPRSDGWINLYGTSPGRRRMHRHDEPEFNLVCSGRGAYLIDDSRVDLTRGTLVWLLPEQNHLLVDESRDFSMWVAVIRPEVLERLADRDRWVSPLLDGRPTWSALSQLGPAETQRLDRCYRGLHVDDQPAALRNAALAHAWMLTWQLHGGACGLPPIQSVHPAVHQAAQLLRDEATPMNVDVLARQVGLSPSRLSRLFRRQTGVSLTEFRQRQCLARFADLYGRGDGPTLLDAALQAGFGSYPQFHRVFRRYFGISPRQHATNLRREAPRYTELP